MNRCYWITQILLIIVCFISFILGFVYYEYNIKNPEKQLFIYDYVIFFTISILCILLYCGFVFYQLYKSKNRQSILLNQQVLSPQNSFIATARRVETIEPR